MYAKNGMTLKLHRKDSPDAYASNLESYIYTTTDTYD